MIVPKTIPKIMTGAAPEQFGFDQILLNSNQMLHQWRFHLLPKIKNRYPLRWILCYQQTAVLLLCDPD